MRSGTFQFYLVIASLMIFPNFALTSTFEIRTINEDENVKSRWDQEYAQEQLYAVVDGIDYLIAPTHERWMGISLDVVHEGDLDGDGLTDCNLE